MAPKRPAPQPKAVDPLAALKQRYPFREDQIDDLAALLASPSAPILCYGPASTGKTAVVRDLLAALGAPSAYVNCVETVRPRAVFELVLHQLRGAKRRREDGYGAIQRCDNLSDFLAALRESLGRRKRTAWIVLDAAHRLAGTDLLTSLACLPGNLGLIMISQVPWSSGKFSHKDQNLPKPQMVHFEAYKGAQLLIILRAGRVPPTAADATALDRAYDQFLETMVRSLARATNNILDLRVALGRLWPLYSAPLVGPGRRDVAPAALAAGIKKEMQRVIAELDIAGNSGNGATNATSSATLPLELPYMSKFLLLAAYVASRNKPTTDRAVFDSGFRAGRGRRDGQALDRQAEAAEEAQLRGPHSFPMERLLHIFYVLFEHHGLDDDDEGGGESTRGRAAREVQRAEVQMQITTLVGLRMLSVAGGDILQGGVYRCNLSDEAALGLAANVKIQLSDWLKLA